ncbi:alpha/beta hydrolase family protein [Microlunatus speluncae]|uniref:alpha/beta hydrolase family protein n=1 Tax=Microlunatus speluncae TaxID=2594267 RepID=UPI0012666B97|nr:alpha/beta hydrolase family protein [Microlunatus speluncae]
MVEFSAEELLADLDRSAARRRAELGAGPDHGQLIKEYLHRLAEPFAGRRLAAAPTVIEQVECDGYRRDRIELSTVAGLRFRAYVLVPGGPPGPWPTVLAVHGHGYGSRQLCGLLPDGSPDPDDHDGHHHFAVSLVRRGLLVVAPDVVGFGERRSAADQAFDPEAGSACYRLATALAMGGATLTGLRVAELLGVVDHLADRDEVDPERIGIVGHSGGSMLSMIISALDQRIAATVLCGYPNTFAGSIRSVRHCLCNYLPALQPLAEQPDLLGLIAPRPLFLESGARDPIFPRAGFEEAVLRVGAAYTAAGAADRFGADLHPGGHEVSGRRAFDWLADALTGRLAFWPG